MADKRCRSERGVYAQILLKDFYSATEVATLIHCSRGHVYRLAEREEDPLLLRCIEGGKKGFLIQRDELIDWYRRNYMPVTGRKD